MTRPRSGASVALILTVLSLGLVALLVSEPTGRSLPPFVIGTLLVVAYFRFRRGYWLLVLGCLLVGVGLGMLSGDARIAMGDIGAVSLGTAFAAIYAIDSIYRGDAHWWPLVPAMLLILSGVAQASGDLQRLFMIGWPILLVLAGFILLASGYSFVRREERAPTV